MVSDDDDYGAAVQRLHRPQDILLAPSQDQPDSQDHPELCSWWWWWGALLLLLLLLLFQYKYCAATVGTSVERCRVLAAHHRHHTKTVRSFIYTEYQQSHFEGVNWPRMEKLKFNL